MQTNNQNPPDINKPRPAYGSVRLIMSSVSKEVTDCTDVAKNVTKNVRQLKHILWVNTFVPSIFMTSVQPPLPHDPRLLVT